MAWHLYAVVDREAERHTPLAEGFVGVRGAPVRILEFGPLAVAASELDGPWERPAAADLSAHAEVARRLVLDGLTVLPFRFGVVAPSEPALAALIRLNAPEIRARLTELAGKVEAALVAFWERDALRSALLATPEGRKWASRSPAALQQDAYLAGVEVGRAAERIVRAWRDRYALVMHRALVGYVLQVRHGDPIGIRMLLNLALLIERRREAGLVAAVDALQERFRGRLRLRLTVPLPPFTFGELALKRTPDAAP